MALHTPVDVLNVQRVEWVDEGGSMHDTPYNTQNKANAAFFCRVRTHRGSSKAMISAFSLPPFAVLSCLIKH